VVFLPNLIVPLLLKSERNARETQANLAEDSIGEPNEEFNVTFAPDMRVCRDGVGERSSPYIKEGGCMARYSYCTICDMRYYLRVIQAMT
jgi:hypothetical protein